MRSYWLAKTEPETFSWEDMLKEKSTMWDGVRNYAARNNLRAMEAGDLVLIYHSVSDKCVVGIAEVTETAFDDPSDLTGKWSAVRMKATQPFPKSVSLQDIKNEDSLQELILIKNSRLSVQPVDEASFHKILQMGGLDGKDI